MDDKVARLAELVRQTGTTRHVSGSEAGRNRLTRVVDRALLWFRRYAWPLHWLGATLIALGSSSTPAGGEHLKADQREERAPGLSFHPAAFWRFGTVARRLCWEQSPFQNRARN